VAGPLNKKEQGDREGALGSWKRHLKSVWKENKKNNFSGPGKLFLICNWKGLPLQWRFGQLEKAPEKLSACSQECLEGKIKNKIKNNFSGPEKLFFFQFAIGRVSLYSAALGSWKST